MATQPAVRDASRGLGVNVRGKEVVFIGPAWCVADCHPGTMQTVYEAAGGADGLLSLAVAWHARVLADEVVSHTFSHGYHPQHTERLAAYWAEALGGPTRYSETYGDETSVVRIHSATDRTRRWTAL